MSSLDEEVYSTIFNALRHGVRRNILRMLSAEQLSFTSISERLGITSSHLTYHLEALKELISKDDSRYKLSVFGKAAVDMMVSVEEPPKPSRLMSGGRPYRALTAILCIGIIIIAGIYIDTLNKYNKQSLELQSLTYELDTLNTEYNQTKTIIDLALKRPHSYYIRGIDIVSGYNVNYVHRFIDSHYDIFPHDYYVVFYAPKAKLTLQMSSFIHSPLEGFKIPLTLQRGNALLNESGVFVAEKYNITIWQSPVIWSKNVTSGTYDFVLPAEGWYTLCMTGPISVQSGGGIGFLMPLITVVNGTMQRVEYAQAWVDFKLLKDGEPVLFAVSRN